MDPHHQHNKPPPPPQPQPAPSRYGSLPPTSDPERPPYTAPPGPPASSFSSRPHPNIPETTYPPPPASEPPMAHRPPATAPVQIPAQTSPSATSHNPPPFHLTHASPRPIPDQYQSTSDIPPGPSLNSFHDHPSNHMATTFHPPQQPPPQHQHQQQPPQPPPQTTPAAALTQPAPFITKPPPLDTACSATQSSLRELLALRRQQLMVVQTNGVHDAPPQAPFSTGANGTGLGVVGVNGTGLGVGVGWMGAKGQQAMVEERVRAQTGLVLRELEGLQARVGEVLLAAEGGRWRRFLVGGVVASFIPLVKKLFRRPKDDDDESSNRTEYAFKKSKSLVSRILASASRPGLGTLAFFVFAVLYVFQNEVTLRVARSVSKRLKRIAAKVEDGREEVTENDVRLLQGWRWRVVAWSE